jgi:hypothetical protein
MRRNRAHLPVHQLCQSLDMRRVGAAQDVDLVVDLDAYRLGNIGRLHPVQLL